jgi:protein-S-isoprenylcysteine O-methyltransferase Ste14
VRNLDAANWFAFGIGDLPYETDGNWDEYNYKVRLISYIVLVVAWVVWLTPFILAKRSSQTAQKVDHRARWGMLLEAIAYSLIWQGHFWERPLPYWRVLPSILILVLACVLAWSGTRFLGRQWRVDAGLNTDHELVRTGPYRFVRHPIYASMLCLFCGTGLMITAPILFLPALVLFLAGTEIRVRIEDGLLASRFGQQFAVYKSGVPAYIPLLR